MIIVDTSVWVDHLRSGDPGLARLLGEDNVLIHPYVIGEIALGSLRNREAVLRHLNALQQPVLAGHSEVMSFIDFNQLSGTGIGYLDAHLLASAALTPAAQLWTRDKRLAEPAVRLSLGYQPVS